MKQRCIIKNDCSEWIEELTVGNEITAKDDIEEILKDFNSTLRPYEKPRSLVKLLPPKTIEDLTIGEVFKDIENLLRDLRHEVSNAYGSAWLKANNNYEFRCLMKAYDKMVETNKGKTFKNKLSQVFNNVRDILNADDLKYLCDYDFDSKLKK